jgi:hypothetical protein
MESSDEYRQEIERHERWLREAAPEPEGLDLEKVRTHVRIALQEQWLAQQADDSALPTDIAERVMRRLDEELAADARCDVESGRARNRRVLRHAGWLGGSLAAAAAIVFAFVGPFGALPGGEADPPDGEFYLDAFEAYVEANDRFAQLLAIIEEDLAELEDTNGEYDPSAWQDSMLEDLRDDIDLLAGDATFDFG